MKVTCSSYRHSRMLLAGIQTIGYVERSDTQQLMILITCDISYLTIIIGFTERRFQVEEIAQPPHEMKAK